jgi:hypothetical protein
VRVKAQEYATHFTGREMLTLIVIILLFAISVAAWFAYFYARPSTCLQFNANLLRVSAQKDDSIFSMPRQCKLSATV